MCNNQQIYESGRSLWMTRYVKTPTIQHDDKHNDSYQKQYKQIKIKQTTIQMLNIIKNQEDEFQRHNEMCDHTLNEWGGWKTENSHTPLVGLTSRATTMETSTEASQKSPRSTK